MFEDSPVTGIEAAAWTHARISALGLFTPAQVDELVSMLSWKDTPEVIGDMRWLRWYYLWEFEAPLLLREGMRRPPVPGNEPIDG